ncbi:MAG: amidase [Flaviaesturariibacter sp.]|nr:amidase [Flaviaesturariibacter sp.]
MFKERFTITENYLPKPSRRRGGAMLGPVKFIVAHDTGNAGSTARANVKWYINTAHTVPPKDTSSAHLFVDDKEIIECVPAILGKPEKAWHVLYAVAKDNELYGANANDNAIGVEYCFGGAIDDGKSYEKYVWVLAKLCYMYKLDPATSVVGHFFLDPKRKSDPVTGLARSRRTYEKLLKDVVEEYNACTGKDTVPKYSLVQMQGEAVSTVKLNVRHLPTTKSAVEQTVAANTRLPFTGKVTNGEAINNNPVWYQDVNGNYFWSGGVEVPAQPALPANMTTTNAPLLSYVPDQKCLEFIQQHEGLKLEAYQDSAGIWTIGYGSILYEAGDPVKKGDTITIDKAFSLLTREVEEKSEAVRKVVKPGALTQNQFDALVSFAYNVGAEALKKSTLLKRVNANPADPSIREAFLMWNKAHVDGKLVEIKGLTRRREEEADLYFS